MRTFRNATGPWSAWSMNGPVAVSFLGAHGTAPLALMLLIAGVGVAVIALTIGFLRSESQRRRRDGAHRRVAPTSRRVL